MKKIMIMTLVLYGTIAAACDNCNIYTGVTPNDFSHSIQLFYRWSWRYGTFNELGQQTLRHGGVNHQYSSSDVKEYYATYELRARYFFNPRLSVMLNVPFRNNYRSVNSVTTNDIYGLGDPMAVVSYRLFNSKTTDSVKVKHRLTLLGGIKAPLGAHQVEANGELVDHDLQPGSGSFDGIVGFDYYALYNFWGLNASMNYKLNTKNAEGFRYGDRTNVTVGAFANVGPKNLKFVPFAGWYLERSGYDRQNDDRIVDSQVFTSYFRGALGVFRGNWSLNTEYLLPISQKVDDANLKEGYRFRLGLSYYFK